MKTMWKMMIICLDLTILLNFYDGKLLLTTFIAIKFFYHLFKALSLDTKNDFPQDRKIKHSTFSRFTVDS